MSDEIRPNCLGFRWLTQHLHHKRGASLLVSSHDDLETAFLRRLHARGWPPHNGFSSVFRFDSGPAGLPVTDRSKILSRYGLSSIKTDISPSRENRRGKENFQSREEKKEGKKVDREDGRMRNTLVWRGRDPRSFKFLGPFYLFLFFWGWGGKGALYFSLLPSSMTY